MNNNEAGNILQIIDRSINTLENRKALVDAGNHAQKFIYALRILKRKGILDQANVDSLVNTGEDGIALADGLSILYDAFILNKSNFIALVDTQGRVGAVVGCLNILHFAGFLNKPNFCAIVAALEDGDAFAEGLVILNGAGILNQLNINALVVAREDARRAVAKGLVSRVCNGAKIPAQPNHGDLLADVGGLFSTKITRSNTIAADESAHKKMALSPRL